MPETVERVLASLEIRRPRQLHRLPPDRRGRGRRNPRLRRQRPCGAGHGPGLRREAGAARARQHRLRLRRGCGSARAPLREDDPTAPVNVYGASKALGETLARLASDDRRHPPRRVALRGGRSERQGRQLRRDHDPRRPGEGCAPGRRRPDHVPDRHRGCRARRGADADRRLRTRFLPRGQLRCCDLVRVRARDHPARECGGDDVAPCATGEYPVRAARPCYSALDNAKVSAAFGAMPAWEDALDRYLRVKGYSSR